MASATFSWPTRGFSSDDLKKLHTNGVTRVDGIGLRQDGRFNSARVTFSNERVMESYVAFVEKLTGIQSTES